MLVMLAPGKDACILVCFSSTSFWCFCIIHVIVCFTILCRRLANMQMVAGIFVSLTQKVSTAIAINGMQPAV